MSGPAATGDGPGDELARAADELAAVASQGQADVESPTGGRGEPAGSDAEGPDAGGAAAVDPDDVAPGPDGDEGRGAAGGSGA